MNNSYKEVTVVIISHRSKKKVVNLIKKKLINFKIIIVENSYDKSIENELSDLHKNIEIIFIDDSSKDNSLKILKYYQELYQFKIIHLDKQKLVSDVLNKGLLYIDNKTSHIGILNGDCIIPNNFFRF